MDALFRLVLAALLAGGATRPSQDAVAQALREAAAAEESGEIERAQQLLRDALDGAPRDVALHSELGRLLYAQGETAEGLGLLWRAVELGPRDVPAATALARALLAEREWFESQGDTMNADANLERARDVVAKVKAEPAAREPGFRMLRVRLLLGAEGGGEEAFALAGELAQEAPDALERHGLYVEAATAAHAFDRALAWYDAAGLEPWIAAWYGAEVLAARATFNFNHWIDDAKSVADYDAAALRITGAARLHPEIFDAASERISFYRSWSGWVLHRQDRLEEAMERFVAAWGRNPANENAITGAFWVCGRWHDLGELEKEREGYRVVCQLAPARPEFWNNYGLVCRDTGHYEESYRAYRRALELAPDDPRLVNDCALLLQYHLHRDLDLAELWYVRAEDLSRANFAAARADGDEARAEEQRAILGDALVNLARLFADQGRHVESAEHWNELRAVAPERPELPENQGR